MRAAFSIDFLFFPPIVPLRPLRSASGVHARVLWGTYHPELVEGPLPSRSTLAAKRKGLRGGERGEKSCSNSRH